MEDAWSKFETALSQRGRTFAQIKDASEEVLLKILEALEITDPFDVATIQTTFKQKKQVRILAKGLPPLNPRPVGTDNGPSINKEHESCPIRDGNFRNVDIEWQPCRDEAIWNALAGTEQLEWSSETSIQNYVSLVFADIIQLLGQQNNLKCLSELGISNIRPDMWIIKLQGRPIGVIEVKKPHPTILHNEIVHGQLFDYMHNLKTYFGLQYCFGILATYSEWRILWNTEAQELAEAAILPAVADVQPVEKPDIPLPESIEQDDDKSNPVSPSAKVLRSLRASRIYARNDPLLIPTLASVVLKMMRCPTAPFPSLLNRSAYIVLQPDRWIWGTLPAKKLNWTKLPTLRASYFHLLQILGKGEEGLVWLACSSTGNTCALKFAKAKSKSSVSSLRKEKNLWNSIWGLKARIIRLMDQDVLLMPVLKTLTATPTELEKEATRKSIEKLANLGYIHNDLHWRHVGFYGKGTKKNPLTAIIFDLSTVELISQEAKAQAYNTMLQCLAL